MIPFAQNPHIRNIIKQAMEEQDLCNWWGKKVYTDV
jgi:hypothetical protein